MRFARICELCANDVEGLLKALDRCLLLLDRKDLGGAADFGNMRAGELGLSAEADGVVWEDAIGPKVVL